ncbi:hypothetical protein U0035_01850 [Niabella yanshanensis]|uniref:Uncharacterized protein n=1 Tax=Niabella yanshanensis TaxID=577386 RepID=A0ABZ0W6R7_9BACT|nr:hypothetical protein [Niabella yanshanensis]WQD38886.1 hypothetical protein U0035_01850 [Niabella yanshanensis]
MINAHEFARMLLELPEDTELHYFEKDDLLSKRVESFDMTRFYDPLTKPKDKKLIEGKYLSVSSLITLNPPVEWLTNK